MKKIKNKKAALLDAFDKSQTKKLPEVCKIAGASMSIYYFHFYKDAKFRNAILEKKLKHLEERIAAV
jgi:hypothetical protein